MEIKFTQRGAGWRARGRPRTAVPAEVLDALRATYDQGVQAEFSVYGSTDAEVRAFVALLKKGAAQLGKQLRQQVNAGVLRFYLEDE